MKMNKKKVFVTALAVSLIAILSMGSIAWFNATDNVTNKFMVATSEEGEDSIFSIDVFEQVDTDGDGIVQEYDATLGAFQTGGGFTYKEILPGDDLGKKPWVRNTGSYDQYVRVKVTINNAKAWKAIFANHNLTLDDIFLGHDDTEWKRNDAETTEDTTEDTMTYVYYLNRILKPWKATRSGDAYLFTSVKIPTQLTQEDMATFTYEGGNYQFNLDIVAEAVQTEHLVPDDQKSTEEAKNAIIAFENAGMND